MYKVYQIRALTLVLNTVYFHKVTVTLCHLLKDATDNSQGPIGFINHAEGRNDGLWERVLLLLGLINCRSELQN